MLKIVLAVALVLPASAAAVVFGYRITFKSELDFPVRLTAKQYHASNFGGTRDRELLPENLDGTDELVLAPGAEISREYNDAGGGYWVAWSASPAAGGDILCTGEVDFTRGRSPYRVALRRDACAKPGR
jgi:hypothetical protein